MKIKLVIFFIVIISYSVCSNNSLLKKALDFEDKGNYKESIKYLKDFIKTSNDEKEKEKTQLKIARLTEDFKTAITEYNNFLNNFPKSRFRFFARSELGKLYILNNDLLNAKKEFYKIVEFSKGTPYWQSSMLEATKIEIVQENYKKAVNNLYYILNEVNDYEEIGISYFLLGLSAFRQKSYLDAEEFFLISAGSFPQSTKAATSLLELLRLYLETNKNSKALKVGKMLNEFYTDSPENNDSYSLLVNITENIVNNEENVELIDLNENPDIKNKTLKRLREDLRLSNEFLDVVENKTIIQKKIFVQIGFFSQEENALERIKICKNKDINDAFI
ncbi:MAG TPA: hypothetical protein PK771_15395, partial [Spirochaetota bacterium]|nr:hypothetical protein [Spirochaetota bacterium]